MGGRYGVNVSVTYVRAGMEEIDGDQSGLLQGAMVIAFTSLGVPPCWEESAPAARQYVPSRLWTRAKQIIAHAGPAPLSVWAFLCAGDKGVFYLLMSHSACVWVVGGALFSS